MTDLVARAPFPATVQAVRDYLDWHIEQGRGQHAVTIDRRGVEYSLNTRRLFINAGLPDDEDGHDNQHVFLRALPV